MSRPRQFDPDVVLDRAMAEFWRHGYAGTSLDELLTQLGIARASMYRAFGTKSQFYSQALHHYRDSEHQRFEDCITGGRSALDAVDAIFQLIVEQSLDPTRPPGCFIVAATAERVPDDPDTTTQVTEQLGALEAMFVGLLTRGIVDGDLPAGFDARRWARFLATAVFGLRTVATARPDRQLLEDIVAATLSSIHAARDIANRTPTSDRRRP